MPDESVAEVDSIEEEILDKCDSIRSLLSDLSNLPKSPKGVNLANDPFSMEEIDFESQSWIPRLFQLQGWLHLGEEILMNEFSDEASVKEAMTKIFGEISPEGTSSFTEDDGLIRLTLDGAEFLEARLSSALSYAEDFQEALDSRSLSDATDEWLDQWDSEETSSVQTSQPINAETSTIDIKDLEKRARKGQLNLNPTYQRGNVWALGASQKLIESLLRQIPLPSIIILERKRSGMREQEVVDGKQRITAILRFMGKHPEATKLVKELHDENPQHDLVNLFQNNYKLFKRKWKVIQGESLTAAMEAKYFFPFPIRSRKQLEKENMPDWLLEMAGQYYCDIKEKPLQDNIPVEELFEDTNDYKIPQILFKNTDEAQIHQVFNLYNQQGIKLNAEEIRNATFHKLKLAKLLLAASGDNTDFKALIPFIADNSEKQERTEQLGKQLSDKKFGVTRYRKTKVLSWLLSILLLDRTGPDGNLQVTSTKKQIDDLFVAIGEDELYSRFETDEALEELLNDLAQCVDVHSNLNWPEKFITKAETGCWQELQLVASLVGVFLVCQLEDAPLDFLESKSQQLESFTEQNLRPGSAQNVTQFAYIGKIAVGLLEVCGLDVNEIDRRLRQRFGNSCVPTLLKAREKHDALNT